MSTTPAATSIQLARADTIGRALSVRGWSSEPEPRDLHPGAVNAARWVAPLSIGRTDLLVLTLGRLHGQMIELTREPVSGSLRPGRRRTAFPGWRLTAYDAPASAVIAAALATGIQDEGPRLEQAGWDVEHTRDVAGRMRVTGITRPDGAIRVEFYTPTLTPPCQSCAHPGAADDGGWLVAGPGFNAEATAHTPGAVVSAFALGSSCARAQLGSMGEL